MFLSKVFKTKTKGLKLKLKRKNLVRIKKAAYKLLLKMILNWF